MVKFSSVTHKGHVREKNEDSVLIRQNFINYAHLLVVADGMGGHSCGEVASEIAVESLIEYLLNNNLDFDDENKIKEDFKCAINYSNRKVVNESIDNENYNGMGTTLTAAIVYKSNIYIGHVGDSRAYLIRDGNLIKLTEDHSFVEELLRAGEISQEEADNHPRKNIITRALGCDQELEIDIYKYDILESDKIILCTDGLTNMVREDIIIKTVISSNTLDGANRELLRLALDAGGKDNITIILAEQLGN